MKPLLPAACAAALLAILPRYVAAEDNGLTLQQALARARERAPTIAAAKLRIDETRGRVIGASVLLRDNPEIEAAAGVRMRDEGNLAEGDVGVRQLFEIGGQRGARITSAEAAVDRELADTADATRRVLRDTAAAFWDAVHAHQREQLAEDAAALTAATEQVARRRYRAGDVGPLDVNIAESAAARQRSAVFTEKSRLEAALGGLRVALGMRRDEPLAVAGDLRERPSYNLDDLLAHVSDRPDLTSIQAASREAAAEARLGRALQWPSVGLGARYERDDGTNVALGQVTVTLPVFEHGQGVRAEAVARQHRLDFELQASRRAVEVAVQAAFDVYQRRLGAVDELEHGSLPRLGDNERLARRSYEAGQLSLPELLVVRREILETRMEYLDRLHDAAIAAVDLEANAGVLR